MKIITTFFKLEEGGQKPVKTHPNDAGWDLFAASEPEIVGTQPEGVFNSDLWSSIDYIQYKTNLFLEPADSYPNIIRYDLRPRSSISKYWLSLCNTPATIDHDYRGNIMVRFRYLWQPSDLVNNYIRINQNKIYQKGDKICQMLPEFVTDIKFIEVNELGDTDRGEGGFGSTGK
jgi:deoxyuridine 5'-triphosphate nucleotidohydrolase